MATKERQPKDQKTFLMNFSTCSLCGHFLATLLSVAGNEVLDSAMKNEKATWLEFEWNPAFAEALRTYYDLLLLPDFEHFSGQCPVCFRRFIYTKQEDNATLRVEIRPGSR